MTQLSHSYMYTLKMLQGNGTGRKLLGTGSGVRPKGPASSSLTRAASAAISASLSAPPSPPGPPRRPALNLNTPYASSKPSQPSVLSG